MKQNAFTFSGTDRAKAVFSQLSRVVAVTALLSIFVINAMANEADFFVAPNGSDNWSGTLADPNSKKTDGPFASLTRARDAVRELKHSRTTGDITVMIRGGTYVLDKTVVFTLKDSGSKDQSINYVAYPDEEPVITSGVEVNGWKKLKKFPTELPAVAHGNIWVASLPESIDQVLTLYQGFERLPRARSEAFAPTFQVVPPWAKTENTEPEPSDSRIVLRFPPGKVRSYSNLKDVELLILPTWDWTMNILPLASVDESRNRADVAVPATYPLGAQAKAGKWKGNAWIENTLESLDEPGEWVVDTDSRLLLFWPKVEHMTEDIYIPTLAEYVRVEGQIDFEGPADVPVTNLHFRGLTFVHGERDLWDRDHAGLGLQHDWEMFDRGNALFRFRGAENCSVTECSFKHSGGTGIRLDLHCQDITVRGSEFKHLGSTGILLAGYGPGLKNVNGRNLILNNHIHHTGELYWHAAAILVFQSEANLIAHNLIHHTPYNSVVFTGIRRMAKNDGESESSRTVRWHELTSAGVPESCAFPNTLPFLYTRNNIFEKNEIHQSMMYLGDGNGIYVSGAGEGNIIRRNYIHDIKGPHCNAAIRTDGYQRGTVISHNIIVECTGFGITIKDRNDCINNFVIDNIAGDVSSEVSYLGFRAGPNDGCRVMRNIFYHSLPTKPEYYFTSGVSWLPPVSLKEAAPDRNLFYWKQHPDSSLAYLHRIQKEHGIDQNSLATDPGFIDPGNRNFNLTFDSPARKIGIEEINLSEIGLLPGFPEKFQGSEKCYEMPPIWPDQTTSH